ncbi:hypothetical protein GF314_05250 [bacterium]|nr:hypothetical protein [bacterium]
MDEAIHALSVVLTSRCGSNCRYCYRGRDDRRDARWQDLRPALDWTLSRAGPELAVEFTGGEPMLVFPLLCRTLDDLERHASPATRLRPAVLTAGRGLDDARFAELTRRGVDVHLSCDGVAAAQDARAPGSFADVDRLLRGLASRHPEAFRARVSVSMVVTPGTVAHLAAGVRYLLDLGVRRIRASPVLTPCPGWDDPRTEALAVQFDRIVSICLEHRERTGEVPFELLRRYDLPVSPPPGPRPVCHAATTGAVTVDLDGRLVSCALFATGVTGPGDERWRAARRLMAWGRPGDPGLEARRADHGRAVAGIPEFVPRAVDAGPRPDCRCCEVRNECVICPFASLFLPGDEAARRAPGFLCAFQRVAFAARQRFAPIRPSPTVEAHPAVIAKRMRDWQRQHGSER